MTDCGDISTSRCPAVIPARAGSKRLLGENTSPLSVRPLIDYTIEVVRAAHSTQRIAAHFAPRAVCRSFATKNARGCCSLQFLVLFLLVGFVIPRLAAGGPDAPHVPIASLGAGPSFAIADFDGDKRPDVASVEGGQLGFGSTTYSIRFRLTASAQQVTQLIAPPGGVALEARDVNGDNAVDLIVTTAWSRRPVAVFLNHGHGSFLRAGPAQFPGAFCDPQGNWRFPPHQITEPVDISSYSRSGICPAAENAPDAAGFTKSVRTPDSGFVLASLLIASPGRSPPFEAS